MYTFTSESVSEGHPDKIADQISDAVVDACITQDPKSKVACETLVTDGLVVLAGEITTKADFDMRELVRKVLTGIGYNDPLYGFDAHSCGITYSLHKQSPDIAQGVDALQGAGDQGMMFGYATDETAELMPLPIQFAHKIQSTLKTYRKEKILPYLAPDAKCQVSVDYKDYKPTHISTIVLSTQHLDHIPQTTIRKDMIELIKEIAPQGLIDNTTIFHINPTGRFVIGGPRGDTGLTGRKLMVDTYGGMGRHGGGAFSGKDPTKVDRSAAYMARYLAKNIVAAKLASRCEIEIAYAIGVAEPVSLFVNTFGTGKVPDTDIQKTLMKNFDLTPQGIIKTLNLLRPIYLQTASGGHFGRSEPTFTWERTDAKLKL